MDVTRPLDGWWRRWQRYGACPYCHVPDGEPCEDQRWPGTIMHGRWCRHPHPERKHVLKPKGQAA